MRKKSILAIIAVVCITAVGCLKNVDTDPPKPTSYIYLMHAAPTAPAVEIYFDDTKVSDPIGAGSFSSSYSAVDAGYFGVSFKKAGGDSVVADIPELTYDSAGVYTLLLYSDPTSGQGRAVRIKDDLSNVTLDKAYYRFFNMVPNIDRVDLYIDGTLQDELRAPADNVGSDFYNQFTPYAYGYHTLQIKAAGKDSVIAQANDVSMVQGNAYTIVFRGYAGATGTGAPAIAVARAIY